MFHISTIPNFQRLFLTRRGATLALFLGLMIALTLALLLPDQALAGGVVGTGTPASCTEGAFATAFASQGEVTFDCGAAPVIITLTTRYDVPSQITINGGGLVTLHGANSTGMFLVSLGETFTVTNVTLTGGRFHDHGAIENLGTFTANNATFKQMNVQPGTVSHSPVLWNKGTATLQNSVLQSNLNFDDAGGPTQAI
ncbi:MAG: hypothetical protein JW953_17145 [Anaerolineae bacterium]|nr:hypothetical protein [Anaerolineae bacterium]